MLMWNILMECKNFDHTRRKFYNIKSMSYLFNTINPNNLINLEKKTASNQRYKSTDQNLSPTTRYIHMHTLI